LLFGFAGRPGDAGCEPVSVSVVCVTAGLSGGAVGAEAGLVPTSLPESLVVVVVSVIVVVGVSIGVVVVSVVVVVSAGVVVVSVGVVVVSVGVVVVSVGVVVVSVGVVVVEPAGGAQLFAIHEASP
jgi:hypothetical protein